MEALVLALLMLAAVLLSSVIDQLVPKVSSPLIQIGLGLLIALFAPSQINITLDPDLFLVLFIACLLYTSSSNILSCVSENASTPCWAVMELNA